MTDPELIAAITARAARMIDKACALEAKAQSRKLPSTDHRSELKRYARALRYRAHTLKMACLMLSQFGAEG